MSADRRPLPDRIDGWKSIGAYFGRDRTTAIRWARDRELPVHRIPGGKTGTVFALRSELELWARGAENAVPDAAPEALEPPAPPEPLAAISTRRAAIGAGVVVALLGIGSLALPALKPSPVPAASPTEALPGDPVVAERFLAARDLVAERNAESLERAIALLRDVIRRDPGYAAGHAALAEALILSREFGIRDDATAFLDARIAARNALRIDPRLPGGYRMLGFIAYWWDRDITEARAAFERAIQLAPDEPTAHFWYGNILADYGDAAAALRHLNIARMRQPGSVAILTDLAWAQWLAGGQDGPLATLTEIARQNPNFAVAHDCLAIVHLSRGDLAGYAVALARFAELRQNKALAGYAAAVQAALKTGAGPARQLILNYALDDAALNPHRTHAWPAFVASIGDDRLQLLTILRLADQRKERWGEAGFVLRMKQRWTGDKEIMTLLSALVDRSQGSRS